MYIHSYSRKQAINDGYLIDVSETASEVGFKVPVSITSAVYEDCVRWDEEDYKIAQDTEGRLWDVLFISYLLAKSHEHQATVKVELARVPREGNSILPAPVELKLMIHGGDKGEPVVTIMMPTED